MRGKVVRNKQSSKTIDRNVNNNSRRTDFDDNMTAFYV